ncbi:MAG: hypothetical protein ACRD38_02130 [Nitrososphaerales archaeon]
MNVTQKAILRKMYFDKIIGGKHTAIENLKKGFPSHLRGDVDDEVKELIRHGLILPKTTSYGLQVSLNPRMIAEIERILEI